MQRRIWSVQFLNISESEYKVLTDCADANLVSLVSTHSESEYKVLTDWADVKVGQFSFYIFQRVRIKC